MKWNEMIIHYEECSCFCKTPDNYIGLIIAWSCVQRHLVLKIRQIQTLFCNVTFWHTTKCNGKIKYGLLETWATCCSPDRDNRNTAFGNNHPRWLSSHIEEVQTVRTRNTCVSGFLGKDKDLASNTTVLFVIVVEMTVKAVVGRRVGVAGWGLAEWGVRDGKWEDRGEREGFLPSSGAT